MVKNQNNSAGRTLSLKALCEHLAKLTPPRTVNSWQSCISRWSKELGFPVDRRGRKDPRFDLAEVVGWINLNKRLRIPLAAPAPIQAAAGPAAASRSLLTVVSVGSEKVEDPDFPACEVQVIQAAVANPTTAAEALIAAGELADARQAGTVFQSTVVEVPPIGEAWAFRDRESEILEYTDAYRAKLRAPDSTRSA